MSHHTNQEARNRCVKTSAAHATPADDLAANAALFARHLRAGDRSPRTIDSYLDAVRLFDAFLADRGMPRDIATIRREHIEAFVEDQLARLKPASAAVRYRSLQQFFRWLVDEGELRESPMARIKPPTVPETPRRSSARTTCDGSSRLRTGRHSMTAGTRRSSICCGIPGMRRSEIAGLRVEDIDEEHDS